MNWLIKKITDRWITMKIIVAARQPSISIKSPLTLRGLLWCCAHFTVLYKIAGLLLMVPQWSVGSILQRMSPYSSMSCHCSDSTWIFSVQGLSRDNGMGETPVRDVSFCESVCEDASDASKTGGAPVYCAAFDSPPWMSGGGGSPHPLFYWRDLSSGSPEIWFVFF